MTGASGSSPASWAQFVQYNRSVLVTLLLVAGMVAAIYFLDRHWRRLQSDLEKATGIMSQSHAYSLNLVRHFMPSFKVAKYQFRGMQMKSGAANIGFEDLSLELRSGVRVLHGVSGEFQAGRMCAIMGPSGAGKTTFMNVLSGKATYGKMGGTITINGRPADFRHFQSITGFVPQDDVVHEDLTVREQIQFSARLRNPPDLGERKIELITDDVLHVMQMDHIQNSVVGGVEQRGISGGQRKRVNIGLELAAQPTVLFLDEPTSGLDSTSSLAVALSLKKMCQLGMTSIMVIHQPRYSLFTLFDDVLLLGKGGQTVYLGPSLHAKRYFENLGFEMPPNENPADWFMDVMSGEVENSGVPGFRPEMLFELWRDRYQRVGIYNFAEEFRAGPRCRSATMKDDRAVLFQRLAEEWDRIDINKDGVMEADELSELLVHSSSIVPAEEVVRELMDRMAGAGAASVTRKQFLDYLCSLSEDVAHDQTLAAFDAQGITGLRRGCSKQLDDLSSRSIVESERSCNDLEGGSVEQDAMLQRKQPGFCRQLATLTVRRLVQFWRMNRQRALFLAALALGAIILAVTDGYILQTPAYSGMSLLNLHTCLALLLAIFCLQVFGKDQSVFWRERARGLHVLAHFQARLWVNTFDVAVQVFVFTSLYFIIRQPGIPFWRFLVPFVFTAYAAAGWGYLVSTLVPPTQGPFIVSLVVFVVCGLLGNPSNLGNFLQGGLLEFVVDAVSITRWSVAMNYVYTVKALNPQPPEATPEWYILGMEKGVFFREGFWFGLWWTPAVALLAMGTVLRLLAFLGLSLRNRQKQI